MGIAILIPELVIYETINNILEYIKNDYNTKSNKKTSYLWHVFGEDEDDRPLKLGKMNLYEQAIDIFVNGGLDKKRKIEVTVGYNMQRVGLPTIHITMPSDNPINAGIGDNEGYTSPIVDGVKKETFRTVTADSSVVYNLIISSDNVNECLIIYNLLKAAGLGFKSQFELKGFMNTKIGGNDLQLADDLMPTNIFHRNFNISFEYNYTSIDPFPQKYGDNFKVDLFPEVNN